jgi:hypothetical protein
MPNNDHTDPGPNWNWTYYLQLVNGGNPNPPEYDFTTHGSGVRVRSAPGRLHDQHLHPGSEPEAPRRSRVLEPEQ